MTDKKEYITPECEIIEFDSEDIITNSGGTGQTGGIYEFPRIGSTFNLY